MPIYAYRCHACGYAKDVLQKLRDAPLTTCPVCHAEAFDKQLTAAGFQLKGSGWYATDFRTPPPGQNAAKASDAAETEGASPEKKATSSTSGAAEPSQPHTSQGGGSTSADSGTFGSGSTGSTGSSGAAGAAGAGSSVSTPASSSTTSSGA